MENEFNEFYEKNFDRIFNFIYSRSPNFEDAQDIVSEVFSAIWNNWKNIEKEFALNFTFKVARNKLNDFLRKQYQIYNIFSEDSVDEIADNSDINSNANLKENRKFKLILEKMVEELKEKEKLLYKLKYKDLLTFSAISSEMNITKNNAKVMNNRLMKKFKILCQKIKI